MCCHGNKHRDTESSVLASPSCVSARTIKELEHELYTYSPRNIWILAVVVNPSATDGCTRSIPKQQQRHRSISERSSSTGINLGLAAGRLVKSPPPAPGSLPATTGPPTASLSRDPNILAPNVGHDECDESGSIDFLEESSHKKL